MKNMASIKSKRATQVGRSKAECRLVCNIASLQPPYTCRLSLEKVIIAGRCTSQHVPGELLLNISDPEG